jgi:hypothetical protein
VTMIPIPLPVCKDLAAAYRCSGVLVMAFGDRSFKFTSYGMTRERCDALRKVNDQIADLIEDGTIVIPEVLL